MAPTSTTQTLHSVVHCYLTTLRNIAEAMGGACPPVGGPFESRMNRLRTRLSFNTSKEALELSATEVGMELEEYAAKSAAYIDQHARNYRQALELALAINRKQVQRQAYFVDRLRQLAHQMETASSPDDPGERSELISMQTAALASSLESMEHEAQSLLQEAEQVLKQLERRQVAEHPTDSATGLMTREEMERYLTFLGPATEEDRTRLLFTIHFEATEQQIPEVLYQTAKRLSGQWRHHDRVCRWGDRQFLVLFHGDAETAEKRGRQAIDQVEGRYALKGAGQVEVRCTYEVVPVGEPAHQ